MKTPIINGYHYTEQFKATVLREYKRRSKTKVGVTYTAIGIEFEVSPKTVKEWVLNYRPNVTAMKRPNGNLFYKGVTYAPIKG